MSNEAGLLLDGSDDLLPGTSSTLGSDSVKGQKFFHVLGNGSTGNEVLANSMGNGETFEDWHSMGNTISGIANDTSGTAVSVKRHDSLDGNVETIALELLEHDFGHLFSVGLGVSRSLSEKDVVLRRIASELVVESVLPDLVHARTLR